MFKSWLVGAVVGSSLLGAGPAAAEPMDLNRGMSAEAASDSNSLVKTYDVAKPKARATGLIAKERPDSFYLTAANTENVQIPDTLDLRPKLSQIEDQGHCGSCWAFGLTAAHRDGHALGGHDPGRLSAEWLVDTSKEAAGCRGGDFDSAQDFVSPQGQPAYNSCVYMEGSNVCPVNLRYAAHITGWHMMGDKAKGPSVREIESYIASSGKPVAISVAAGAGDWMNYNRGIYNGCKLAEHVDHMINIVGWDNEGAQFNQDGNLPPGKGVWILRNSWGQYWGEHGYMRSRMTDANGRRCNNVAQEAVYFDFDD